jgi:hypothetical protein
LSVQRLHDSKLDAVNIGAAVTIIAPPLQKDFEKIIVLEAFGLRLFLNFYQLKP